MYPMDWTIQGRVLSFNHEQHEDFVVPVTRKKVVLHQREDDGGEGDPPRPKCFL